jgi:hypothetical protein
MTGSACLAASPSAARTVQCASPVAPLTSLTLPSACPVCLLLRCTAARAQKGILKLRNILEGLPEAQFNAEEYMNLYTCVCTPAQRRHVP